MLDKALYTGISSQVNDLPLFHKAWWLDISCPDWDAVVVKKGNVVTGVWPFSKEQKIGISITRNPALTPYMGPHIFFPKDLKESKRDNFEHETISEMMKHLPEFKVWSISCRPGLKQVGLFQENKFNAVFRQTFILDLQNDINDILPRLHEDFRRSIKKADSEMTITEEADAIPTLYQYQKATMDRREATISYPLQLIQRLHDETRKHDKTAVWVARKNGEIQAILWNMWDDIRAYYLVGSKNPAVKDNHAVPALLWQAAKHSKQLGKISLDFEGSMIPGVERFFRNFGAERVLYPTLLREQSALWKAAKAIKRFM